MLAVVLAVGVTACDGDGGDGGDGPRPTSDAPPAVQPVYRIKDAETAVAGEDYEVLREIPGSIAYKAQLLLDDGTLVLVHERRYSSETGEDLPDLVQVWDPATDRRESLPIHWPKAVSGVTATSATDLWVSFSWPFRPRDPHQVMHYDRSTGRARVYTPPSVPRARRDHVVEPPRAGPDGRIYFLTGSEVCVRVNCLDREDRQLWSFAPGSPQRVRLEAFDVEAYDVSATHVAWVEPQDDFKDYSKRLSVRAHDSDRVRYEEVQECHGIWPIASVQLSDDLVLACGELYGLRAQEIARLDLYSHGLSGITDEWLAYGWTVLHPRTGRFLQILDDRIWHDRSVVMNGDRILWPGPEGPPNARNADWTLARLLPGQPG